MADKKAPKSQKGGKAPKEVAQAAPVSAAIPPPPASSAGLDAATAAGELRAKRAHGFRRKLVGKVTSDKMNKTVTVEVIRNAPDPVYQKYVRVRERYKAHDETNQYKVGDKVEITEHRPISRNKCWMVTKLVARPVVE